MATAATWRTDHKEEAASPGGKANCRTRRVSQEAVQGGTPPGRYSTSISTTCWQSTIPIYRLFHSAQAGGYSDCQGRSKSAKGMTARNWEREQNRLHMCQVRKAQRAAKEGKKFPLRLVDLFTLLCYASHRRSSTSRNLRRR